MKIEARTCHTNKGYGDFKLCPFCGGKPYFSIGFYVKKEDKEGIYHEDDYSDYDKIPDDVSGFILSVYCINCTIHMIEPWFPDCIQNDKDKLLDSDYYIEKFQKGSLIHRWNQRFNEGFTLPIKVITTSSGINGTYSSES